MNSKTNENSKLKTTVNLLENGCLGIEKIECILGKERGI